MEVIEIDVQICISSGMPCFNIVGLPDKAVGESRERIRAAMSSIGLSMPPKRITVNLSPADITKEGSHYDLAIILGILVVMEKIAAYQVSKYIVMGELSLDGMIMPVPGILPAAIFAKQNNMGIICSNKNSVEAVLSKCNEILATDSLIAIIRNFNGTQLLEKTVQIEKEQEKHVPDMKDVAGQESAKLGVLIAAAGGHNLLMVGPPGTGKSMLAERLPGLLPDPSPKEILEINMVASVANRSAGNKVRINRPFRYPHHSCSIAAMIGGGKRVRPGEVTLASKGVLFLDELPEFSRAVLDSLRQPIESKNVTVARVNSHVTYPADFQFVGAMNPCKCGYLGNLKKACNKTYRCGIDYKNKISGPMLDRIDIHIEVPNTDISKINEQKEVISTTAQLKEKVLCARTIQSKRYKEYDVNYNCNAEASYDMLKEIAQPDKEAISFFNSALKKLDISMRGYVRILRIARTIADLHEHVTINREDIAQALFYRER